MSDSRLFLRLSGAFLALVAAVALAAPVSGQEATSEALRVFLDCDRGCDSTYLRQEMPYINWVRDRRDAQVHVLVTSQGTGGGRQLELQFLGVGEFAAQEHTLTYATSRTDTDDEERRGLARTLRLGLASFLAQTPLASRFDIVAEGLGDPERSDMAAAPENDPWNFWLFSLGADVFIRGEERRDERQYEFDLSANRTTDAWKLRADADLEYEESVFQFEDGSEFRDVARALQLGGQAIKTLGTRWGAGAGASYRRSTFFNLDPSYRVAGALQYNLFPYSQSSQRELTIAYFLGLTDYNYEERTIFDRDSEALIDHGLRVELDMEQPWGSAGFDLQFSQFLQHAGQFNLQVGGNLDYRIVRGLSLNVFASASEIRNQRFLSAAGASDEEILLERRALETNFRFFVGFGLNYTFGSIYNNVVNARLTGRSGGFHRIF